MARIKINSAKSQPQRMVFMLLFLLCHFNEVLLTSCPIDGSLDVTEPGNSYECPDLLPDGGDNDYNHCCHNDTPDENGDYHSCCKDPAEASADKMGEFINICIIIVCVTIAIMIAVFVHTYCKDDTFPCLIPLKKECRKWYNMFMDSICFCSCCPKKFRRKSKKEILEDKELERKANQEVDPSQMEVPTDDFWI